MTLRSVFVGMAFVGIVYASAMAFTQAIPSRPLAELRHLPHHAMLAPGALARFQTEDRE